MFWRHCMTPLHQQRRCCSSNQCLKVKTIQSVTPTTVSFSSASRQKTSTFTLGSNCKCEQTSVKVRTVCVCVCVNHQSQQQFDQQTVLHSPPRPPTLILSLSLHFLPHTLHLSRPPPLFSASSSSQKDGQTLQMDEKMKHQITQTLPPPPSHSQWTTCRGCLHVQWCCLLYIFLDWLLVDDPLILTF